MNLLEDYYRYIELNLARRKGMDKPIFLIASLTLAIMFVMAYYLATTGWMSSVGDIFNTTVNNYQPEPGGSGG
ncbi:MAG: hypothetical protein BRC29_01195 [Nanohaloarchaea archaeon SW_7_43_1]|nr:MAG: hypothetical protein BRC29_01195 [Nanohaloarchaea archaeon SW_7_43_1]